MNSFTNKTILAVIFVALITSLFLLLKNPFSTSKKELPEVKGIALNPTPTPFEFQDYTIPHLRQRKYGSNLATLNKNYENPDYTAYLTSYDSDGFKINGLLTVPKAGSSADSGMTDGKYPAVIFIHGYIPPTQYNTLQNYYDYVDYLARNGLVVFKIDLRGHADSEGEPGGAYYSADYIVDVLNAYSALQKSDYVDSGRIGLWGHSMAGNVVMRSFAAKPEIPAVVIWAGAVYTYTDQQEFGINDSSYRPPGMSNERQRRRQRIRDLYGEPNSGNLFWQQMAPTNYLNDLKGAVQIHHAVNDDVVNIGYSRGLNELLDKTAVKHELHEYPDGGHNISGSVFNQAMQRTVNFFRENL